MRIGTPEWNRHWSIVEEEIQHCLVKGTAEGLRHARDSIQALHDACEGERDYRCGYETYGYSSKEDILANISYISDRFGCQFRTRWLLDMIDGDKFNLAPDKEATDD